MTEQERVEKANNELSAIMRQYGCFLDVGVTRFASGREVPTVQVVAITDWQPPAPDELAPDAESA